jgi:hypothetical protein
MTSITLSQSTQNAIKTALNSPGANNSNNIAAYNAISAEIKANGSFNTGTAYWFSQAGAVNSQYYNPTAVGTYIWGYTQAAALSEGVTITNNQLLTASNKIAQTVFDQLNSNGFVLSDNSGDPTNFAPASIIRDDAGSGLATFPAGLTTSVWGGTLFAQTVLNDPTYISDYHIDLTQGSEDCNAITSGVVQATNAVTAYTITNPSSWLAAPGLMSDSLKNLDTATIQQCFPNAPLRRYVESLN